MKTFQCTHCGFLVQRPTQPFSCPQCGRQAINLFRPAGAAPVMPAQPGMGMPQGYPVQQGLPAQPGMGMPGMQMPGMQMPQGYPPQQGLPAQPGMGVPGMQMPQGYPVQPGMQAPQGIPPQGGYPMQPGYPQQNLPQQGTAMPGIPMPGIPMPGFPTMPGPGYPMQPGAANPQGMQPGYPQQPGYGFGGQQPAPQQGPQGAMPAPGGAVRVPRPGVPQSPFRGVGPGVPGGAFPTQPPSPQQQQPFGAQPWPPSAQSAPAQPAWPQQQQPMQPQQPLPQQPPLQQFAAPPQAMPDAAPPAMPQAPAQPILVQPVAAVPVEVVSPPQVAPQQQPPTAPPMQPSTPQRTPGSVAKPQQAPPAPQQAPVAKPQSSSPSQSKPTVQPKPTAPRSDAGRTAPPSASTSRPATPSTSASAGTRPQRPTSKPADSGRPAAATKPAKPVEAPRVRPKPLRPEQFVWAFPDPPPYEDEATPMRHAPAVDADGQIYLHAGDRLVALKEEEGRARLVWEYVTGCRAPGAVVVAPDGSIRVHTADGLVHAISAQGRQVWSPARVGQPLGYAAPVVDAEGNTYICNFEGGLLKVDPRGKIHKPGQFFRARQKFDAGAVLRDQLLYVGSDEGYLFAIELGGEKGRNAFNHAADQGHTGWYVHSSPALTDDGMIVVAGCDENLYGFRPTGDPAWRAEMPGQMLGSPVLDSHGHIYIGLSQSQRGQAPQGSLVCLDGNSHKIRWEYRAKGPVESTPVIGDDDVLYFGDNGGVIHAIDNRGNALWTAKVESAVRSSGTILAPGRLAFGLDNQTLVVLKCSSQSIAAAGWPKFGRTLSQNGGL